MRNITTLAPRTRDRQTKPRAKNAEQEREAMSAKGYGGGKWTWGGRLCDGTGEGKGHWNQRRVLIGKVKGAKKYFKTDYFEKEPRD